MLGLLKNFLAKTSDNQKEAVDSGITWETPTAPNSNLPETPCLTPEYFPDTIADFVFYSAEKLDDAPTEYTAVSIITAAAALIGGSAVIAPKKYDVDWQVVPTIWGGLVGDVSTMKSPSLSVGPRLTSTKSSDEDDEFKLVINNTTLPALVIKLSKEKHGVLICHDELTGWLTDLESSKNQTERAFYLSAFNGDTGYSELRVGRSGETLDAAIVSILGGIQPEKIRPFLQSRINGKGNDGLFERIQLCVFPETKIETTDIKPDRVLEQKVKDIFAKLLIFRASNHRTVFRFSDQAQEAFSNYRELLKEKRKASEPLLRALLSKYAALCAKLALIFHLLSQEDTEEVPRTINKVHLDMAIKWVNLTEMHYKKLMAYALQSEEDELLEMLVSRLPELAPKFSKRVLGRREWKGVKYGESLDRALKLMEEHGYIKKIVEKPQGRIRTRYLVHPDYCRKA